MADADRHKKGCSVSITLSKDLNRELEAEFCEEGGSFQSKAEPLLLVMLEIALQEKQYRLRFPLQWPAKATAVVRKIRLFDSDFGLLKSYAEEENRSMMDEATTLFLVGAEFHKMLNRPFPLRKEEFARRIRQELDRRWGRV